MSASESLLGLLHLALAEDLTDRLKSGEATAADRAVIAKFLKDNAITCAPSEDNALGELARRAAERSDKKKALLSDAEKAEVSEVSRIMGGMH